MERNHHLHETRHLKQASLLQEEKYRRMTTEPVGRLVCEMAVPTIISMLVTAAYNLADTFFVGLMRSNAATGAVGIAFSLMAAIQAIGFFFGQGSGNYISRQLGRHETEDAESMAITAVVLALVTGAVLLVLGQLFLRPLARALGSTDTILPYACDYLRIILLGAPFITASFVLNNQLRFQGSAVYSMVGIVAGAAINVVLDPLLIFTLDMGITGAAVATVIGQLFSFALLLFGCTRGGNLRLHPRKLRLSRHIFREIARGGFPSLCRQGMMALSGICLNLAAGVDGDAAIAAMSVVNRVMTMANSALIGFGQGFQPVCGFNYGAKLYDRVRRGYRFCVRWGTVFLVVAAIVGFILAPQLIALFRDDPQVVSFGTAAMRWQCVTFPLAAYAMISNMMTQTMGKTLPATLLAAARQGLFFIPAVLLLPLGLGELGVQLAQSAADVLSFLLTVVVMRRVNRALREEENAARLLRHYAAENIEKAQ